MQDKNNYNDEQEEASILAKLQDKQILLISPRFRNGLIIYKQYHAEFAGPGSIIGGELDADVIQVLPVGDLSLVYPQTSKEKISGYLIRRQWVRLIKQVTDNPLATERAQIILSQFEHWFDLQTANKLPDEALAMLVGVLPQTIRRLKFLVVD